MRPRILLSNRHALAVGLTTVDRLACLLDLLEDLLVGNAFVCCDVGSLCIEGDVV